MARPLPSAPTRSRLLLRPPVVTLALWRLRTTWRLLLLAQVGMLAAVLLLCTVPLFSQIALAAGLRDALSARGQNVVGVQLITSQLSPDQAQITPGVNNLFRSRLGPYLAPDSSVIINTPPFPLTAADGRVAPADHALSFVGMDVVAAAAHLQVADGRLPAATSAGGPLEVALSESTLSALGLHVGSAAVVTQVQPGQTPVAIPLRIVGSYRPPASADTFFNGSSLGGDGSYVMYTRAGPAGGSETVFPALAANLPLVRAMPPLGTTGPGVVVGPSGGKGLFVSGQPYVINWNYTLDVQKLRGDQLDAVVAQRQPLEVRIQGLLPNENGPRGLSGVAFNSSALYLLASFQQRVGFLQIPVTFLLLEVCALVLLFVRLIAEILVERQSEAIAVLRSRGAYRRQIFGTLALHGLSVSLVALVAGPLLAVPLVRAIAERALPPASRAAVDVLGGNLLTVAWNARWFALAATLGGAAALIFSITRAAGQNVLALRRESARTSTKPFWQRLNLDVLFMLLAGGGYAAFLYFGFLAPQASPQVRMALSPLSLIAPFLFLVAFGLFFIRMLPLVLRVVVRLAARARGAPPMLAFTQIVRAPRQATRVMLLLALSTGFAVFALIFSASQLQYVRDAAAYRIGADFAGTLPASAAPTPTSADSLIAGYAALPGVQSATVLRSDQFQLRQETYTTLNVLAVDPATFGQTARWSTTYAAQPLPTLMQQLADARAEAERTGAVPALVDAAAWRVFGLTVGQRFSLALPGYAIGQGMNFIAVAQVEHIPTIYDTAENPYGAVGLLVDYHAYNAASVRDFTTPVAPNAVWLRTSENPAALTALRAALTAGPLAVTQLGDLRQVISGAVSDPLQINLLGTLGLGVVVILALALLGAWIASWMSARARVTQFAVLRALGMTPRQMLSVLAWEYAIVYGSALVVGAALGLVLAGAAKPLLLFSNLLVSSGMNSQLVDVPPIRTVLPVPLLAGMLGGLLLASVLALALVMLIVSRSSLGETLRLNED